MGAITVFIQKYIPVSYVPYIVHTNVTQIVNIRPNLDILFRFLIYNPAKMAAGINAVPGSEAIKTIGKNNISSIHLPHWQPNVTAKLRACSFQLCTAFYENRRVTPRPALLLVLRSFMTFVASEKEVNL